jgi:acetamidase/formamidase
VRDLSAGSALYLPVQTPGALLSLGDAHAAQGNGEVCINGIECPVDVTVRLKLLKNKELTAPLVESAPSRSETGGEWIMVESDAEPLVAARRATLRMIEFLAEQWSLSGTCLPALQCRDGSTSGPGGERPDGDGLRGTREIDFRRIGET